MKQHALAPVQIIDLTHYLAGPYCTKLLAGFGADVVKIERPERGDPLRQREPFYKGKADVEHSIPFLWLNTGKKSITLNLKTAQGASLLKKLVAKADVLVENFAPRVLPELGLDYGVLRDVNPRLVMASISNFGQTGPYRDYLADERVIGALSGQMDNTGAADSPPLASAPALNQYAAGMHAYTAILMALLQRGNGDKGQHIDISIMETGVEQIENRLNNYLRTGKVAKRGAHVFAPWGLYPCKDGYATIISAPFRHWIKGAKLFDEPRLLDSRYRHARDRARNREKIDELIEPWVRCHDKREIFRAGQEHGLSFGYLADAQEVLESPQHRERRFFSDVEHPKTGRRSYADAPFKLSRCPWKTERAPLLGEHNQEIYGKRLGYPATTLQQWHREGAI